MHEAIDMKPTALSATSLTPSVRPAVIDAARWRAVLARSRAGDGVFVYAVRSTGVYCRPSCPSRRPRRDQVTFYLTPADAERAGYRACLRCRPAADAENGPDARVLRARRYLDEHLDERVTLARLAAEVGASAFHLQRRFVQMFGLSPRAWVERRRLERLKGLLRDGERVSLAGYESGFGSSRGVYVAARRLGMTPAAYRRGGRGERIRYVIFDTPVGCALIAATDRGVCAASLGDRAASLVGDLRREYPHAHFAPTTMGRDPIARWARAFVRHLERGAPLADVPLDLRGTEFQRRVWQALREIPFGERRTYRQIAAAIGRPRATRAVASACAANRAAIVVPCHRVVRADGKLGGYRWSVARKRRLAALERGKA